MRRTKGRVNGVALNMAFEEKIRELGRAVHPEVVKALPKELCVDPVDVLGEARTWCAPVNDPDYGAEYLALVEKLEMLEERVLGLLPAGDKKILDELENVLFEIQGLALKIAFRHGLRDGFRLASFVMGAGKEGGIDSRA
ncbi:hypothetical protein PTH_0167 [Pelotomaculum thermopropionicum SI]|uniref:Uncharacterized protein n=1 Tax=Pelotomaculum thermopropionicum (strain DSM 13744 / JCM 10971 / SI) TaxID=370438 RepID=A5D5Y3_PELTS|nr:hypothetical protein PTH_0167 [Pelotomaculum thermopropionicum SI]